MGVVSYSNEDLGSLIEVIREFLWHVGVRRRDVTMAALTPQVFWAQRHTEIYLRVELSDAKVGQSR